MCLAELVVITGPIGAGKSSVARKLTQRLLAKGCTVACVDLDDIVETLSAPAQQLETSWRRARRVHGVLISAWLRSGTDVVITHGPFYTAEETAALLAEVPDSQQQRWVLLLAPYEVALERVQREPDRRLSRDPGFLRRTHERFNELLSEIPACDWTFDTTRTSADESASVVTHSLIRGRVVVGEADAP